MFSETVKILPKVAVALSGGLDSSTVALSLLREGYDVVGVTFLHGQCDQTELISQVDEVSSFLGIEHHVLDFSKHFVKIIEEVDIELCHLRTPNICGKCAVKLKFGILLNHVLDMGCEYLATGHYVKIIKRDEKLYIQSALDPRKDQSYCFSLLSQSKLKQLMFPLANKIKTILREEAIDIGLPFFKHESTDICFVPDKRFSDYYERTRKDSLITLPYISKDGDILGECKGTQIVTIGQRVRHLSGKSKKFVIDKTEHGIVIGDHDDAYKTEIVMDNLNFYEPVDLDQKLWGLFRTPGKKIEILSCEMIDDHIKIILTEPLYAPCCGQIGALYDVDNCIVGGGIICETT
jgi:tRNA-uridine 2-sulfurtransferase